MKKLLLILLLLLVSCTTSTRLVDVGNTYYVSQTGSGTECSSINPCTYSTGHGKLQAGDTLQILGTLNNSIFIGRSGTIGNPITIRGGKINAPHTVQNAVLVASSHLIIENIEVTGGQSFGIRIGTSLTTPNDIIVRNFSVHDSVWENRSGDRCIGGTGGWGRGFTIGVTAHDIEVYNGDVYNNCGEGLAFTQTHDVRVHDVVTYDNFSRNVYVGNSYNIFLDRITSYCENPNFFRNGSPAKGMGLAIETTNYSLVGNILHDVVIQNSLIRDCHGINFYQEVPNQFPSYITFSNICFINVPEPHISIPGTNIVIIPCNSVISTNTPTRTATPTRTPSRTPTASPTATFTPTMTVTPTPAVELCPNGIPEFVQKDKLYYYCLFEVPTSFRP